MRDDSIFRIGFGLILGAAMVCAPAQTWAQNAIKPLYIHEINTVDDQLPKDSPVPGLGLRVVFSVLDPVNGSVRRTDVDRTELKIGRDTYTNEAQRVVDERSIVVLVDASATLGASPKDFAAMRDGLKDALGQGPETAFYQLMTFGDDVNTVEGFTKDRERITKAIPKMTAKASGNSCLNEGINTAVRTLSSANGRRSVIVLTASSDTCGKPSVDSILTEAANNKVQINAVVIKGYAARVDDLNRFATPTKGVVVEGGLNDPFAASNLMSAINNQWLSGWTVWVPAGKTAGNMTVRMKDGTSVAFPIEFSSQRNYPKPTIINIAGVVPTGSGFKVNMNFTNQENLDALEITVTDKKAGATVARSTFAKSDIKDSMPVLASNLKKGTEYEINAVGKDSKGNLVPTKEPKSAQWELLQGALGISQVEIPGPDPATMTVTLQRSNMDDVDRYKVWLEGGDTGDLLNEKDIPFNADKPLIVPIDPTIAGTFSVKVRALDSNKQPLAADAAFERKITITRTTSFERLIRSIAQNPIALVGLALAAIMGLFGSLGIINFARNRSVARVKGVDMKLPDVVRRAAQSDSARVEPMVVDDASLKPRQEPKLRPEPVRIPEAAARATASLTAIAPEGVKFRAELNKPRFSIGRAPGNDGVVPVDGTFGMSGKHVVIISAGGDFYVQDDASTNGTSLNGKPVAKGKPVKLTDGDTIGLGPRVRLQFKV